MGLLSGWPISYREFDLTESDQLASRNPAVESIAASPGSVDVNGTYGKLAGVVLDRCIGSSMMQGRWSLSRSGVRQIVALFPSVKYEEACGRIRIMFRLSVLMAGIATLCATAALANGISSARLMGQQQQLRAGVELKVAGAQNVALDLYSQPDVVAQSLMIADSLSRSMTASPEDIVSGVATAVSAVSGVSIDRLAWAVVESDNTYESFTHSLSSVASRRLAGSAASSWKVQVEISGRVPGKTLVRRMAVLDALLEELGALPGAMDIQALESPVDLALSSSTDRTLADQYRLTMTFDGA